MSRPGARSARNGDAIAHRARFGVCALVALLTVFGSAPPLGASPVTAVPKGAVWKYLASPTDQGTTWRAPGFNDNAWPSGPAALGYGETTITTVIPFGTSSNKWRTTYFRITFQLIESPADVRSLLLDVNYDDGFVAYLNGVEVRRASMPAGTITYGTFAASHESGAYERFDLATSIGALVNGTNVLAVEVHQTSASSSDLALDAELSYSTDSVLVTRGPYLQIATPTGIHVRWRTDVPTTSAVRYGASPGSLTNLASDAALTTEHEIALAGLTPGTRYDYTIGTVADVLAGDDSYTFRTPPPAGTSTPTRIWIIGDSGQANQAARNVYSAYDTYAAGTETDLWLMLGDNAYSTGTDAQYQAAVFETYPAMLRSVALWPTRGNHDALYTGANNDYYDIFTMPTDGSAGGLASGSEAYYSFDHANVHFVCLDSEGSNRSKSSPMLQWLRADLAATAQPWIVAFWHHPPYSKGSHDSDDPADSGGRMRDMRENVLPILDSTGVDLVLAGHTHAYERSFLLNGHYGMSSTLTQAMKIDDGDGRVDGDGPYMKPTAGHAPFEGAIYTVAGNAAQVSGGPLNHPVMVQSSNVLGSLVLDVDGERMDARFIDDQGAVRDSFTIVKGTAIAISAPATAPGALRIASVGPNPTIGVIEIAFELPRAGRARLTVLDVGGRRVATLVDGERPAGTQRVIWRGADDAGRGVAPGVYFALLEQGNEVRAARIVRTR